MTAQHEADAPCGQPGGELGEAVGEETIVAPVAVRVEGHHTEKGHYRLAEQVGDVDGEVERGVVLGALRPLHPVDDGVAGDIDGALVAHEHARIGNEPLQIVHGSKV